LRITENLVYLEQVEIPAGITLQGMADLLADHFHGDRAMHHYKIRQVDDPVVLEYSPTTSEVEGRSGSFCCLNGWGEGSDLFFEGDAPQAEASLGPKPKAPHSVFGIVNLLREERGLPKAKRWRKPQVTREVIRGICIQVWKDLYPRALTDPHYGVGEFTGKLVEQEVDRRIAILKGELVPLKR